jgi:transposase-like protein
MGQQRRPFPPEFKADAVALARSTGRPIAAIAQSRTCDGADVTASLENAAALRRHP